VEEAVGFAGDAITRGIAEIAKTNDPVGSLKTFIELWRQVLIRSDFRAGCPVVAVAAEAQESSEEDARLARATSRVFTDWTAALATGLRGEGIPAKRAQTLATLLIASVEGAVVMSRAQRDTAPLDDVGKELESLIAAALNPAV
jgi:hypothetical protein